MGRKKRRCVKKVKKLVLNEFKEGLEEAYEEIACGLKKIKRLIKY